MKVLRWNRNEQPTCGCSLVVAGPRGAALTLCRIHAAGPETLVALRRLLDVVDDIPTDYDEDVRIDKTGARALLAELDPQPDPDAGFPADDEGLPR